MYIKVSSLVRMLLVLAAMTLMWAALLFAIGGLLSAHHGGLSDPFIYAGVAAAIIMVIAIINVLEIWAIQASKYVVIVAYVVVFGLLSTIFGNKALKRRHA